MGAGQSRGGASQLGGGEKGRPSHLNLAFWDFGGSEQNGRRPSQLGEETTPLKMRPASGGNGNQSGTPDGKGRKNCISGCLGAGTHISRVAIM